MKQIYLTLMLIAFTALQAMADSKLESGSLIPLKDSEVRMLVTWDYSKMLIEDKTVEDFLKEKGADWQRDYSAEVGACEAAFEVYFNKENKKYALITEDDLSAQYEMIIHVSELHYGSTATAVIFGGFSRGAHIKGNAEVVRLSDKETIANISFDCSGAAAIGNEARRTLAYYDLAKDLAKSIKKAKK